MFNWYRDHLVAEELRKDALVQAEKERLIRKIVGPANPTLQPREHILARLGHLLVAIGYRLENRYAELTRPGANLKLSTESSPCE